MVSLYGPDTLNQIRNTSESLRFGSQSQTQSQKAKKSMRNQYLELLTKNKNIEDKDLSSSILNWFKGISTQSRIGSISHQGSLICTFLWQMFIKQLSEEESEFALIERASKVFEQESFDQNFYIRKKSDEAKSLTNNDFQMEKYFEQSIRLTDTDEYLDTLLLDSDLCADVEKLIEYMKSVSGHKVFTVACYLVWDSNLKIWISEYPSWFNPNQYHSIAAWACASIEKSIWMHYWEENELDPRHPTCRTSNKNFIPKEKHAFSQSLESLSKFFSSMKKIEKVKIIGTTENLSQEYLAVKEKLNNFCTRFINCNTLPIYMPTTLYPLSSSLWPCYMNPVASFYTYAYKNKIKFFQSHKSSELILQQLNSLSDFKFTEFLVCSPLDRSVTLLDIVIRKCLYKVINAYTEKNALELLLDESIKETHGKKNSEKGQNLKKKKNKPKNKSKNKKSHNGNIQVKPEIITEEEKESISAMVSVMLIERFESFLKEKEDQEKKIEEKLMNSTENDFQVVESGKKKHKKLQPQQSKSNSPKKSSKHYRRQVKPNQKDTKSSQSHHQPSKSQQDPGRPLLEDPSRSSIDCLHKEIIIFGESLTWKLEDKILRINKILEKLSEIVSLAFQGASIELFGSYASGLAIESSDVDIVVIGLDLSERAQLEISCKYLASFIENYPFISKIQEISTARIPVIKLEINTMSLVGTDSLVLVDITFDDSFENNYGTHLGLSTLYLTKELQRLYPSLQYLVLVLKQFLYDKSLNSSYKGGLSSYSLVLWVAALLNSMSVVSDNLGELLLEFFKFFGNEFDPKVTGVNIINGGSFFELEFVGYEAVVTIDPVNQLNNTRMAYNIEEVLKSFSKAYSALKNSIDKGKKCNILGEIFTQV